MPTIVEELAVQISATLGKGWSEASAEIEKLKAQLKGIGNINLGTGLESIDKSAGAAASKISNLAKEISQAATHSKNLSDNLNRVGKGTVPSVKVPSIPGSGKGSGEPSPSGPSIPSIPSIAAAAGPEGLVTAASIAAIAYGLKSAAEAIAGVAQGFVQATANSAAFGSELWRTSALAGVSVERFQKLDHLAKSFGEDGRVLTSMMQGLNQKFFDAKNAWFTGNLSALIPFIKFGIKTTAKDANEQLKLLTEKLLSIKDASKRQALATAMGVTPLLALTKAIQESGLTYDQYVQKNTQNVNALYGSQAKILKDLHAGYTELGDTIETVLAKAVADIAPEMINAAKVLKSFITQHGPDIDKAFRIAAGGVKILADMLFLAADAAKAAFNAAKMIPTVAIVNQVAGFVGNFLEGRVSKNPEARRLADIPASAISQEELSDSMQLIPSKLVGIGTGVYRPSRGAGDASGAGGTTNNTVSGNHIEIKIENNGNAKDVAEKVNDKMSELFLHYAYGSVHGGY